MRSFSKSLLAAALASLLVAPVRAAPFDMNTTTCQDWIDASDDEQDLMIAWLRGYASGRAGAAIYAPSKARTDRAVFMNYCRKNSTVGLISAGGQLPK